MKKRLISILCMLMLVISLLAGCGKKDTTLPPLAALAALPETRLSEALQGYDRDALILGWGKPERSMKGGLGDTWDLDKERELLVLYNENGRVFTVRVQTP